MPCKKGSLVESLLPTKKWQSSKNKQNWVKQHQESFNHQTKLPPKNISFKTGSQVESLLATKKWQSFSWTSQKYLRKFREHYKRYFTKFLMTTFLIFKHARMVIDVASLLCMQISRVQFHPPTKVNFLTFFLPIPVFFTTSSILPARRAPYEWLDPQKRQWRRTE